MLKIMKGSLAGSRGRKIPRILQKKSCGKRTKSTKPMSMLGWFLSSRLTDLVQALNAVERPLGASKTSSRRKLRSHPELMQSYQRATCTRRTSNIRMPRAICSNKRGAVHKLTTRLTVDKGHPSFCLTISTSIPLTSYSHALRIGACKREPRSLDCGRSTSPARMRPRSRKAR